MKDDTRGEKRFRYGSALKATGDEMINYTNWS